MSYRLSRFQKGRFDMAIIDHSILNDKNMSIIENEYIKLGVNLGLGGAVTYLAELGHDNLINSSD